MSDVILFDGDCRACHALVRLVLPRDPEGRFLFASQGSPAGARLLAQHGLLSVRGKTVVLIEGGDAHLRADAMLRILAGLRGPLRLLSLLRFLPTRLLDGAYDRFSRHRHRLFGRAESCLVVRPDWRARFLDDGGRAEA